MDSKTLESGGLLDQTKAPSTYGSHTRFNYDLESDNSDVNVVLESPTFYQNYKGRIFMALACYLFSYMQLGTKLLSNLQISVAEMLLFRSIITTGLIVVIIKLYKVEGGVFGKQEIRGLLLFRGVFGYFGLAFFMVSLANLHLGDAIALSFTIPIFMIFIAIFYLKEAWSKYDLISIVLGAIGIIYITKPESIFGKPMLFNYDNRTVGLICAIFSTFFNAIGNISIRIVGKRAHFLQVVLYFSMAPILPSLVICYLNPSQLKVPGDLWTWFCLTFVTLSAFIGQLLFSYALQIEKVAKVTPLIFVQVIFAFINDFLMFNFTPTFTSILGAVCVGLSVYASTIGK